MPEVTITLTDTPDGRVAIQHNYQLAAGQPCSTAQAAALDIINRTARIWDVNVAGNRHMTLTEVNIDAVHRRRDGVVGQAGAKR